jgi:hypothetical protein
MINDEWARAAAARWTHLPDERERSWRTARTYRDIEREADALTLELPQLDDEARAAVLAMAVERVHAERGEPTAEPGNSQMLFDAHVDLMFEKLLVVAREMAAPPEQLEQIMERHILLDSSISRYMDERYQ